RTPRRAASPSTPSISYYDTDTVAILPTALPLLANADGCGNIVPHHHIVYTHILAAELYPLTLSLSSPPSLDYLRCGMLMKSLHLTYFQTPSAYTYPHTHYLFYIISYASIYIYYSHHRHVSLF